MDLVTLVPIAAAAALCVYVVYRVVQSITRKNKAQDNSNRPNYPRPDNGKKGPM